MKRGVASAGASRRVHAPFRTDARASVGLYYSTGTLRTRRVAHMIKERLGDAVSEPQLVRTTTSQQLSEHPKGIICGAPSYLWSDHQVSALDWDNILPPYTNPTDMDGKRVAVFGFGDQKAYAKHFADGVGIVWEKMQMRGAKMVGQTDLDGYEFDRSRAKLDHKFVGLVLDDDNQPELTEERVERWCAQLKKEFEIE